MKESPHFRIVRARGDQFRGHIVGRNGKLIWRTEAYPTRALVMKAIKLAKNAINVIDTTKPPK
tara:strand:- start:122 stop:310 length:189 start_codon:yes stop_codon:yes gene_type:complete